MPQVIGIFTALFKREGYTIDLFDCTYYRGYRCDKFWYKALMIKESSLRKVRPYSDKELGKKRHTKKMGY